MTVELPSKYVPPQSTTRYLAPVGNPPFAASFPTENESHGSVRQYKLAASGSKAMISDRDVTESMMPAYNNNINYKLSASKNERSHWKFPVVP